MEKKFILLLAAIVIIAVGLLVYVRYKDQKIKIIYFTNEKCIVNYLTDRMVENAGQDFGSRVEIETVTVSLYAGDPPDPPEVKEMRDKYNVFGAPLIIINEKEYKREYSYDAFKGEICKNFIVKPSVCLWKR